MGLLDGLMGSLIGGQQQGGQQQGGSNPLLQMALQMLSNHGNGAGGSGGLGGLISAFQNAGMGEQLKSWIGTGENMPISADQLSSALGSDKIRDIATQLGMSPGAVSGGLADLLPQMIDKLTPTGQLPDNPNMFQDALASFLKR